MGYPTAFPDAATIQERIPTLDFHLKQLGATDLARKISSGSTVISSSTNPQIGLTRDGQRPMLLLGREDLNGADIGFTYNAVDSGIVEIVYPACSPDAVRYKPAASMLDTIIEHFANAAETGGSLAALTASPPASLRKLVYALGGVPFGGVDGRGMTLDAYKETCHALHFVLKNPPPSP